MSAPSGEDDEQKYITVSRAYLLGLHYIQKAVIENVKDPEKVEKYKNKFFNLCDTAMEDLFIASAKPKFRILNLLSEINKERLSLLRYINDLKNDDPTNVGTIRRLEQYAKFSLQTYGQLITAYNQHQLPPILKKEKITIPTVSRNVDISPDNCNVRVFNFVPPSTKDKNATYTINIYHLLTSNKIDVYSGKFDKNSDIKTSVSGLDRFRQEPSKMPRLTRSKIVIEITQSSKSFLKKKEESIGEYKFPMHLFEDDFNAQKKFKITGGSGSFEVEASVREPLVHPKEKQETIFIRVSDSCNVRVHASTTTTVPQPSAIQDQSPQKQQAQPAQPSAARRTTTNVPNPKSPIGNTQNNVPAPGPQLSDSEQKKQKAKSILIKSFLLLPKEELLQFIDTTSIELMEAVFKENLANVKKMNLEMPDEYVQQNAILVKKKEKIQNDIQSGKLSIDEYKALLQKQIPRNREAMKKTKNPMLAAFLGKSADNMEEELKSFDEADDDDEE